MYLVRVSSVFYLTLLMIALVDRAAFAQTAPDDIVLRVATVSPIDVRGDWARVADPTAAGVRPWPTRIDRAPE